VVREIIAAEQARGALTGTPGSHHARHSGKPTPSYGPGFFGGKKWSRLFWLGVLVSAVVFFGGIGYLEATAEHGGETTEEAEGTGGEASTEQTRDG
jgi:hypothetical protein